MGKKYAKKSRKNFRAKPRSKSRSKSMSKPRSKSKSLKGGSQANNTNILQSVFTLDSEFNPLNWVGRTRESVKDELRLVLDSIDDDGDYDEQEIAALKFIQNNFEFVESLAKIDNRDLRDEFIHHYTRQRQEQRELDNESIREFHPQLDMHLQPALPRMADEQLSVFTPVPEPDPDLLPRLPLAGERPPTRTNRLTSLARLGNEVNSHSSTVRNLQQLQARAARTLSQIQRTSNNFPRLTVGGFEPIAEQYLENNRGNQNNLVVPQRPITTTSSNVTNRQRTNLRRNADEHSHEVSMLQNRIRFLTEQLYRLSNP